MKKSFLLATLLLCATSLAAQTRINCGGAAYTDKAGNVWQADTFASGGQGYSVTTPITGTPDPTLYQSLRFTQGSSMTYTVPVANGQYNVNLLFAEIYFSGSSAVGKRVVNVKVNGVPALTNFDIFAKVGANTADVETIPVTVTNGQIVIEFAAVTPSPQINAIDIEPGPPPPFVWVMPGLGNVTFPMQIPPACSPSDGVCSIQIQVCDTSQTPPVCMTAPVGTLSLVKTVTLPTPQVQTIPVAIATNP